jgi:hypothetical protein
MSQMPWGLESCGCRAVIQAGVRSVTTYVERCKLHDSAPDLLEALERIESHGRDWDRSHLHEHECYEDIARVAIAKASE